MTALTLCLHGAIVYRYGNKQVTPRLLLGYLGVIGLTYVALTAANL